MREMVFKPKKNKKKRVVVVSVLKRILQFNYNTDTLLAFSV